MAHVTRLTIDLVTEDELPNRKQKRIAQEIRDMANTVVIDGADIGLIKDADLQFEIQKVTGHTHKSTRRVACEFCYSELSLDQVHDPNE